MLALVCDSTNVFNDHASGSEAAVREGLDAVVASATGRVLVDEIARRQPAGAVSLVGYSFGASMALEVAAQLAEAGRTVGFLAALDGPFDPPTARSKGGGGSLLAAPRRLLKSVAVDAAESMNVVRRLVAGPDAPEPGATDRAEPMRRAMLWHLRNKALKTWVPRGCDAPGLHVSTGDYEPGNRLRWAALCPNLRTLHVSAPHEDLLKGEALSVVVDALAGAVRRRA